MPPAASAAEAAVTAMGSQAPDLEAGDDAEWSPVGAALSSGGARRALHYVARGCPRNNRRHEAAAQ